MYATLLTQGTYDAKKHHSGWFFAWIFLNTGSNLFPIENKKIRQRHLPKKSAKHCTVYTLHFADFFLYADTGENS
jgi:hypothetical protein